MAYQKDFINRYELQLSLPLLVNGYNDATTQHVYHLVHHSIFTFIVHYFLFEKYITYYSLSKTYPAFTAPHTCFPSLSNP